MHERLEEATSQALAGGPAKYHEKLAERGKLFVRDRIRLLIDEGSLVEDGLLAINDDADLAGDGVVTGRATIDGRPVMDHRPDRPVPRTPRRGEDLLQPDPAVGKGPADLLSVRPLRGGWRVHPFVLRRRRHG